MLSKIVFWLDRSCRRHGLLWCREYTLQHWLLRELCPFEADWRGAPYWLRISLFISRILRLFPMRAFSLGRLRCSGTHKDYALRGYGTNMKPTWLSLSICLADVSNDRSMTRQRSMMNILQSLSFSWIETSFPDDTVLDNVRSFTDWQRHGQPCRQLYDLIPTWLLYNPYSTSFSLSKDVY